MSSTHRGAARAPLDNYPTPGWCTRAILPFLPLGGRILEPACGEGAIVRELVAAHADPRRIVAVDIKLRDTAALAGLARVVEDDFLRWQPPPAFARFDLVISNPPYALAQEFVAHALDLCAPGGVVAMLLRLNFLGSQKRAAWLRATGPSVYVLPRRPSFTGNGTDSCEYAWFVWTPNLLEQGRIRVLDMPPLVPQARDAGPLFGGGA